MRRWKRLPDGSYVIKSRLCARGFLDPQKSSLPTHSQTASRLTQRLLISTGVNLGFVFESWDVGAAFLKGFSFEQMDKFYKQRGIPLPKRRVILRPPKNVWSLLREIPNSGINIQDYHIDDFFLDLLKAMYGLNLSLIHI